VYFYVSVVIFIKKNYINKKLGIGSSFKRKQAYNTRSLVLLSCFSLCFLGLLTRIGYIQFVNGPDYKTRAYKQQTTSQVLFSKRGTIYDASGKILAMSSAVDTISVNNGSVFYSDGKTKVPNDVLAQGFSEIFGLDYNEILEKLNSKNSLVTVAKKVEKPYVDSLKAWMETNKITSGINIDEDSKRAYPYSTLASNVLGFCGNDNQGLEGIEAEWDEELSGTPGRIVTSTNVNKQAISDDNEQYIPPQNGSDIYLTIDTTVQSISEKYLTQAIIENKADSGCVIVMKPSTGDILAEAMYPTYYLNAPFSPNTNELNAKWDTLTNEQRSEALVKMWRNVPVSNGYEPCSTFKLITSSSGDFTCNRSYFVNGVEIKCWDSVAHGSVSLRRALEMSCNPSFIQLGQRIGKETFYKYLQAFGLLGKTGVRQPGEASGNFHAIDNCGPIELATMSFGQRFTITPLQLITAVSTCVNGGNLVQPRIVSKTVNTDTGVQTELPVVNVRQVISKSTSDKIKDMMESAVTVGTGKHAQVAGYSIGGKSGTSEPQPGREETDGYVASFIAISPTQNPEVIVLVILYHPRGSSHQGCAICAPVAGQILSEVLPHLGISATSSTSEKEDQLRMLNDVTGQTLTAARQTLESAGFKVVSRTTNNDAIYVTSQSPKSGVSLLPGSVICLYTDGAEKLQSKVPDLKGMTADQAKDPLTAVNLNIAVTGSGKVVSQDVLAGSPVAEGSVITVTLQEEVVGGAQ